jgi:hypothetical protein
MMARSSVVVVREHRSNRQDANGKGHGGTGARSSGVTVPASWLMRRAIN